jgi:hypothetical protein
MAKKIYDLAVVIEQYTDGQGNQKNRYKNIGAVIQKDDGSEFITIDRTFSPAGCPNPNNKSTVIVSKFEPKQKDSQSSGNAPANKPVKQEQWEE